MGDLRPYCYYLPFSWLRPVSFELCRLTGDFTQPLVPYNAWVDIEEQRASRVSTGHFADET